MVYDVTNGKSFDAVERWTSEVREHLQCPIVLIGTKMDKYHKRVISKEVGQSKAQ